MKPQDILETIQFVVAKLGRPVLVVGIWLGLLHTSRAVETSSLTTGVSGYVENVTALRSWLTGQLGLNLAAWHVVLVAALLFVVTFDRVVALLWPLFPWRLAWSTSGFWKANKCWKEPLRLSRILRLSKSLRLTEIEAQMTLAESSLKKDHPELYRQHFEQLQRGFRRWSGLYAAFAGVILLTCSLLAWSVIFRPIGLSRAGSA